MENKHSLCVHALVFILGGISHCLAVKQITVNAGEALTLNCHINNINGSDHVEWRNPAGFLMFFNQQSALKDSRYKAVILTRSQYSVRVSDITFKDGGVYKCLHYGNQVIIKRYKVIVLSLPKLEKTEHEDKTIIKCSASANNHPPRLSWLLENGLEIEAHPNYVLESASNKHTTVSLLHVKSKRRATVKCLVYYSALYDSPLINFIHIGEQSEETTPTLEYTKTTTEITPTFVPHFSPSSSSSTSFRTTVHTSNHSQTTEAQKTDVSTTSYNTTTVNETIESISETTESTSVNITTAVFNSTLGDRDENHNISERNRTEKGNSVLLVILVTCLIFSLIVVLAFFFVRLRRAHVAWKLENEDPEQSSESNRSKSSNEEKQKKNQKQRGQGIWTTTFTKYKEEAAEKETGTTPPSVDIPNERPPNTNHSVPKSIIRETEL